MSTYKYRFADPIKKSLSMKVGENFLLQDTYENTVSQITQRGIQAPILSFSEGGFLSLSLDHRIFHRNDITSFDPSTKDQIIRLVVTEPKTNNAFNPIKHVEPELISVFPEKSTFKLRIPPIQSIYESTSKNDIKLILLDQENLSTNKQNICTHILITEEIANIIISEFNNDDQVEPLDIICSINKYFAEAGISRSTTGKVKISSNNAKELMKFLLLAHHLWNQTDEDDDYISESDIATLCPTVISPDSITEPDLRNQMASQKMETLQQYLKSDLFQKEPNMTSNEPTNSPNTQLDTEIEILSISPPKEKTTQPQLCKTWTLTGSCQKGDLCPSASSHIESNPKERFLLSILHAATKTKSSTISKEAEKDFASEADKIKTKSLPPSVAVT